MGLATTFSTIAEKIAETGHIPVGLRSLVDPNDTSLVEASSKPGALVEVQDEIFSPLPLNERQYEVLNKVDKNAHTIVQGPPGTGKTHMAAALLSHLLAQGKRVLVTAEKARALEELRDKLPSEIRDLAVTVLGSSSKEKSELDVAIRTIQSHSDAYDSDRSSARIEDLKHEIDILREKRVAATRRWSNKMRSEQQSLGIEGYDISIPDAVQKVLSRAPQNEWIESISITDSAMAFPLNQQSLDEFIHLIDDDDLDSAPVVGEIVDPSELPTPQEFKIVVDTLAAERRELSRISANLDRRNFKAWKHNSGQHAQVNALIDILKALISRRDVLRTGWALEFPTFSTPNEISMGDGLARELADELGKIDVLVSKIQGLRRISINGEVDQYVPTANSLLDYLKSGRIITTKADGTVKVPLFGGGILKESLPFFANVKINSLPATNVELIGLYLNYVECSFFLREVARRWPYVNIDGLDLRDALSQIRRSLQDFESYVEVSSKIAETLRELGRRGFHVDEASFESLAEHFPQFDEIVKQESRVLEAEDAVDSITDPLRAGACSSSTPQWVREIYKTLRSKDVEAYATLRVKAIGEFAKHKQKLRREELRKKLRDWAWDFEDKVLHRSSSADAAPKVEAIDAARRWLHAKHKLSSREEFSTQNFQREIMIIDNKLHEKTASLAAERAWAAAIGNGRIDPKMRAEMSSYTQAVKRLGKGTGKYASTHRADVRRHLEKCRDAVPVWIMPIYRVVEQFKLQEDMFDVVIVDEASQAGADAIFLQYLAPRMVVIGDDLQVSPEAVGHDREQRNKIARQYLYDFDHKDSWVDPQRSLFDHADQLFGGRIVLNEHRRCVPEIIEYSNKLVYRPNKIELRPVRQAGRDRLAPFKITRTTNGFYDRAGAKVNKAEALALVEKVCETVVNPAYEGKTIGVISLLSTSNQAKFISNELLNRLDPSIWDERQLKVGSPAEFQGAERDVIFLSMVSDASPERRISSLTDRKYEQRYNVAVSRAKDQIWLFHTIGREDLGNPDDVRSVLLDHAYGVAHSTENGKISQLVSNDESVKPFDSLFEQRVYNKLVQLGYYVQPQVESFNFRIDLVVEGPEGRLAVECDGDYWHSEEFALRDLSRQRELERLGWRFVRVWESDYYMDPNEQIQRIVNELDCLGIGTWNQSNSLAQKHNNVSIIESVFTNKAEKPEIVPQGPSEVIGAQMEYDVDWMSNDALYEAADDSKSGALPFVAADSSPTDVKDQLSVARENRIGYGRTNDFFNAREDSSQSDNEVAPYVEFIGETTSIYDASPEEVAEGISEILAVEGPMKGQLLYQRYVTCGGDVRVARAARTKINRVLHGLLAQERISVGMSFSADGYMGKTFYLPGSESVRLRRRGSRTLEEIPHEELLAFAERVAKRVEPRRSETFMRLMLAELDLVRLTDNARTILDGVRHEIIQNLENY
ncbi:superfamily protein I DNA/RNA helicase [Corynebacterium renale]|uniref:AAA domain-containing protein n=1 Tax=Corynebacterium renale TaxID=1724 RepID=UPI000DA2E5FA|nr:AAA domain-containing protein [Corynebacterium renale]SQG64979.1 superfamily protein I DNA/RNA helicase [Corynebacterium renale]